jgi:hypothetical protein
MIMIIINIKSRLFLIMENELIHIAFRPKPWIHLVDFNAWIIRKQIVWRLYLAALGNQLKKPRNFDMSEKESQEVLLLAIEYLKTQFDSNQNPCSALYIARYYRLLSSLKSVSTYDQKKYADCSASWLTNIHDPEFVSKNQMATNILCA